MELKKNGLGHRAPTSFTDYEEEAEAKAEKKRHAKNIAKGKMSAAYWANKEKW
jgi:hypothetical protein